MAGVGDAKMAAEDLEDELSRGDVILTAEEAGALWAVLKEEVRAMTVGLND